MTPMWAGDIRAGRHRHRDDERTFPSVGRLKSELGVCAPIGRHRIKIPIMLSALPWVRATRTDPFPVTGVVGKASEHERQSSPVIVVRCLKIGEQFLQRGEMTCPGCGGWVRAHGHGRQRTVRGMGRGTVTVTPRRVRCIGGCRGTHIVLPAELTPQTR